METRTTEEQREFIRSVNDSAHLMTSIVNDVLDLQRLQSGRMSFERIPVDLHDVCQSLMKNVKHQASNKRVQLILDWSTGTPRHVISDPTRIHQLLLNFTSNAIKFTQVGNVTLRVSILTASEQARMFPVLASTSSRSLHEASAKKRVHMEDDEDDMQPTQSLLRTSSSSSSSSTTSNSNSSSSATTTPSGSAATTPTTSLRTVHQFPARSDSGQTIAMNFAASTQQVDNERFIHDAEEEAYEHEMVDDDSLSPPATPTTPNADYSPQPHPRRRSNKRLRQTQYVCFAVTDTGMGISPHALPQLFSPYTQAKLSIVREKGGTGLGLSICREIISNLHGQIQVHSELGKGSTFMFVLKMPLSSEKEWLKAQHDNYHVNVRQEDEEKMGSLSRSVSHARTASNVGGQLILPSARELSAQSSAALMSPPSSLAHTSSASRLSPSNARSTSTSSITDYSNLPATSPLSRLRSLANKPPALDTVNPLSIYRPPASKSSSPIPSPRTGTSTGTAALTPSIPLTPLSSTSSVSSSTSGSTTPIARSILVADDNDVNRKILSRILTSLRYRPVMAADGVQAVEAVKANIASGGPPFLCVFMDISMPHLDGYEATRHIRALGSSVPIIALTANALSEERKKASDAGMNGFQTKPIRKIELQKLLIKVVKESADHTNVNNTMIFSGTRSGTPSVGGSVANSAPGSNKSTPSSSQPVSQRSSIIAVGSELRRPSVSSLPPTPPLSLPSSSHNGGGSRRGSEQERLLNNGQHAIAIHG